jgi:hypothetical protein
MTWVAEKVWFCFLKVVVGGDGVVSLASSLKSRLFFEDAGKTMGKAAGSLSFAEVVRVVAPVSVKGAWKQCGAAYVVSELVEAQQAMA